MSVIHISKKDNYFTVENSFVDNYMCDANGYFVKVYLYLLRHSADNSDISLAKIADVLNMLQSDVLSALKYWDNIGVITLTQQDKSYQIDLTYSPKEEKNDFTEIKSEAECRDTDGESIRIPAKTTPAYQMSEINNILMGNERIKSMFNLSSQILNKTLSSNDMKILYSFYDYLKLPVEVIFSLLEYCVTIEKTNMRYIEKVAYSWADSEINTTRKANNYIKQKTAEASMVNKFKKLFKISDRDFVDAEIELLKKWVNDLKCSDEEIMDAYTKTVMNTGKVAFKYMDAILSNRDDGAKKTEAKPEKKATTPQASVKKNSFNGYSSNYGETDIEKELLKRRLSKNKTAGDQ